MAQKTKIMAALLVLSLLFVLSPPFSHAETVTGSFGNSAEVTITSYGEAERSFNQLFKTQSTLAPGFLPREKATASFEFYGQTGVNAERIKVITSMRGGVLFDTYFVPLSEENKRDLAVKGRFVHVQFLFTAPSLIGTYDVRANIVDKFGKYQGIYDFDDFKVRTDLLPKKCSNENRCDNWKAKEPVSVGNGFIEEKICYVVNPNTCSETKTTSLRTICDSGYVQIGEGRCTSESNCRWSDCPTQQECDVLPPQCDSKPACGQDKKRCESQGGNEGGGGVSGDCSKGLPDPWVCCKRTLMKEYRWNYGSCSFISAVIISPSIIPVPVSKDKCAASPLPAGVTCTGTGDDGGSSSGGSSSGGGSSSSGGGGPVVGLSPGIFIKDLAQSPPGEIANNLCDSSADCSLDSSCISSADIRETIDRTRTKASLPGILDWIKERVYGKSQSISLCIKKEVEEPSAGFDFGAALKPITDALEKSGVPKESSGFVAIILIIVGFVLLMRLSKG